MATPIRFDAAAQAKSFPPSPVRSGRDVSRLPATNYQFKDFGVMNAGKQGTGSTVTAILLNLALVTLVIALSTVAKQQLEERHRIAELAMPVLKPIEPIQPKISPKPLPPPPVAVKADPPKIKLPEIRPIEVPKPAEVKMTQPLPSIAPAAPKKVIAPAAPVAVNLARTEAASVVNSNPHPTAVALGQANNPISVSNRPATAVVNLGQHGLAGVPASNTGSGPVATAVNLGSGSAGSQTIAGNGARPVQGVKLGIANGTGPLNSTSRSAGQVNLGQIQQVALPKPPAAGATSVAMNTPKVLWKPKPVYTPEATALHINGVVQVRIRVSASGTVTVLAITRPLGHGLDESAERAARSMRFQPAVDASGRPVEWEGNVTVTFQSESNG